MSKFGTCFKAIIYFVTLNLTFNFQQQISNNSDVVKSDEKTNDFYIETADISNRFKFFETFKPEESRKKEFRITPPREGVVKVSAKTWDITFTGSTLSLFSFS